MPVPAGTSSGTPGVPQIFPENLASPLAFSPTFFSPVAGTVTLSSLEISAFLAGNSPLFLALVADQRN